MFQTTSASIGTINTTDLYTINLHDTCLFFHEVVIFLVNGGLKIKTGMESDNSGADGLMGQHI